MALTRRTYPPRAGVSKYRRLRFLAVALILVPTIFMGLSKCSYAQAQTKLTLNQIEQLVRIGTPDAVIARAIRGRGLEFVPQKDSVEQLRQLGAGPQTVEAVDELRPMLDEAKQQIPGILVQIYKALDQGNWDQVRPLLSPELASNTQKLDRICKPFTFRADYIDAIIERPGREFDVRTRVLFKPLDEHAYVLVFGVSQGNFVLEDVTDPPPDWFGPEMSAASELTRRFIYAVKAGQKDVINDSLSSAVDASRFTSDPCWQMLLQGVSTVQVGQVELESYDGLKVGVRTNAPGSFLVDKVAGQYKIVSAFDGIRNAWFGINDPQHICQDRASHFTRVEDPSLEADTLKRFGLPTSPVALSTGKSSPSSPSAATLAACGDYTSCMKSATTSLQAWQWPQALATFKEASTLDPSKGDSWAGMGEAQFQLGQYEDAFGMWDKALQRGATLSVSAVHAHIVNGAKGIFHLSVKEVSFVNDKGQQEFAAPPTTVTSEGPVFFNPRYPAYYVELNASGKNYRFYYVPNNVRCYAGFVSCPEPGLTQQKAFADYVHRTLVRIAAGDFGSTAGKP